MAAAPAAPGIALAAVIALAFLAISLDVDLSPRLQRGDWRGLASALRRRRRAHARSRPSSSARRRSSTTCRACTNLRAGSSVRVREIDETGYAPLRAAPASRPRPGFRLLARLDVNGLIVYRFVSPVPRLVSEATLRRHVITLATPRGARAGRLPGVSVRCADGIDACATVVSQRKDLGFRACRS